MESPPPPQTSTQTFDHSSLLSVSSGETSRTPPPASTRIDSIDLLRGIVMVIMMLDHTRDFVHNASFLYDPTDLTKTSTAIFFTRWITHFCAPVFVLLAGTGIYLQAARGKSKKELSRFLFTRGLWLIVLEFTVVRCGALFNFDYRFLGPMQVIWVIGVSMIIMAALIHLPTILVGTFGVALIVLHNLLDGIRVTGWRGPDSPVPSVGGKLWMILHQPFEGFPIDGFPSPIVFVIYPLIPWVGVMAAGYALGVVYEKDVATRRRILLILGGVTTVLFIIIRATNLYGDSSPWSQQKNAWFTVLSFVDTTKYPPSLLFLLMTIGPALLALALFEYESVKHVRYGLLRRLRDALVTFGRVPLFFYLLQWPTAHLFGVLLNLVAGKPVKWMFETPLGMQGAPEGVGFDLWVVYAAWIAGVLLLYPLCKWFAGVKQRRRDWWLSYL
jgi:uncharacterized membrane protein